MIRLMDSCVVIMDVHMYMITVSVYQIKRWCKQIWWQWQNSVLNILRINKTKKQSIT